MTPILAVRDLEKTFGNVVAARDISLEVPPQQDPSASLALMARARPRSST
jgi:ABC-type branched-subunit amino acid transport system ATPase component